MMGKDSGSPTFPMRGPIVVRGALFRNHWVMVSNKMTIGRVGVGILMFS